MSKKILVVFQDWGDWFKKDYSKFEFWFKHMDGAYNPKNKYEFIVFGNYSKKLKPEKNLNVEVVKSSSVRQLVDFMKLKKIIKRKIDEVKPDYIYVPFLYLASLLPRKHPTAIGFLRDITPEMIIAKGGIKYLVGHYFYLLDRKAFKKLDIVLNNGKSLEDYAKKLGFKGKLIYNPRKISDIEKYSKAKIDPEIAKLKKQKKKVILTISRLVKAKNIDMGIKALANLPEEYHYVIIGEGEEMKPLKQLAKKLGVQKRVHLKGFIKHEKVWSYYKGTDVYWQLSKTNFEGTPNVLQEAFHAKVPVVVSKIPAMRNIVDKSCGIILGSYKPKELSDKTLALIKDKKKYKKFQENGFKKVKKVTAKNRRVHEFFK